MPKTLVEGKLDVACSCSEPRERWKNWGGRGEWRLLWTSQGEKQEKKERKNVHKARKPQTIKIHIKKLGSKDVQ